MEEGRSVSARCRGQVRTGEDATGGPATALRLSLRSGQIPSSRVCISVPEVFSHPKSGGPSGSARNYPSPCSSPIHYWQQLVYQYPGSLGPRVEYIPRVSTVVSPPRDSTANAVLPNKLLALESLSPGLLLEQREHGDQMDMRATVQEQ